MFDIIINIIQIVLNVALLIMLVKLSKSLDKKN